MVSDAVAAPYSNGNGLPHHHHHQHNGGGADGSASLEQYAQDSFYRFLTTWQDVGAEEPGASGLGDGGGSQQGGGSLFYAKQVMVMRKDDGRTLYIYWQHLVEYNRQIADVIQSAWYRLEPSLRAAVQALVREVQPEFAQVGLGRGPHARARAERRACLLLRGLWACVCAACAHVVGWGRPSPGWLGRGAADRRANAFVRETARMHACTHARAQEDDGSDREFYISVLNLPECDKLRDLRCGACGV